MKFYQWYETKNEELTCDDPLYFYVFGENSRSSNLYNYLEIRKSFEKYSVFIEYTSGLVKRWIDSRIENKTVVPYNENVFDKIDDKMKVRIIMDIFK